MNQNINFNGLNFNAQQQPQYYLQQQQPPYQNYQHGQVTTNNVSTSATTPWPQPQTAPSAQWQTASNSAATTTTTTTTTTKSTRERQSSTPQHATFPTTSDFTSLMQPPPQQQQQHTIDYSQQTTTQQRQQQPMPQPLAEYSQLMHTASQQTQQTPDFSQLMQAPPQTQPQISVSSVPPVVHTPQAVAPARGQTSKDRHGEASSSRTNKTTTRKTETVAGGASRQKAAARGKAELRRFDRKINDCLLGITRGECHACSEMAESQGGNW